MTDQAPPSTPPAGPRARPEGDPLLLLTDLIQRTAAIKALVGPQSPLFVHLAHAAAVCNRHLDHAVALKLTLSDIIALAEASLAVGAAQVARSDCPIPPLVAAERPIRPEN